VGAPQRRDSGRVLLGAGEEPTQLLLRPEARQQVAGPRVRRPQRHLLAVGHLPGDAELQRQRGALTLEHPGHGDRAEGRLRQARGEVAHLAVARSDRQEREHGPPESGQDRVVAEAREVEVGAARALGQVAQERVVGRRVAVEGEHR